MEKSITKAAKERLEQIEKHGNLISIDDEFNTDRQLQFAAIYALTLNTKYYPKSWGTWFAGKIVEKSDQERVTIATALLLAEIDRLEVSEMSSEQMNEYEHSLKETLKDVIKNG